MESIRQSASMIEPYSKERNVWTTETLCAFDEAIRTIPRLGRTKLLALTPEGRKPFGRNELIADYIYRRTGIERDRKQVSSHIQVIKNAKKVDPMLAELLGPADEGANLCFNEHTASWFGACITNEALTLYACTPEFPFPSQALLHLPPYQDEEEYSDFLAKTQITRFSERSKRSELEQERCLRILNMKPLDGSIESQSELCQFFSNYHSIPLTQKESLSKSSEKVFETEKEGKDMLASRIKNDYANKLPQSSSGHHVSETSAQSMRFYEKTSSVAREKDSQYLESLIKVYNTPEKKNPWHTHNHTFQSDLPTTPASVANGFQLAWGGNSHPIGDIKTGLVDCNNGTHSLESTQPFELRVESYMNKMPEQKLNETIDESQVESLNLESPYLDNSDTLCNNVLIINSTKLSGDNNLLTSTDFNNVKDNGNIRQSAATAFDFCNQKTLNEFWKFHSS
ncbi:TEA/ATTS domain family-domain-containing protein [Phakopsora pachyrhizi]|nr:TEA/ATTS domain family-domain-containing protein [Phakopsora pachyrhizi]